MAISTFLANLIIPLNLCLTLVALGLVLGVFRRLRRLGVALAAAGLIWVAAWSLPATSVWLGGALEHRYPYQSAAQMPEADAIVVLGGNTANGRANWFLPYERDKAVVRIDTATDLYRAGRAPKVVLSGGALEGDVSEAQGMAHQMRQGGVPEQALILENSSRTTYENAALTEETLKQHEIRKILLVTSSLHMPRAMAAFSKQGVQAIAAPAPPQIVLPDDGSVDPWIPNERALDASRSIIKEYAGLFVYWLRGWV
ncbi:YdcF family protein [Bordetella genomosp. 13]|uniref:YdcF family protein n=1 Tax=Bordetella genomosp. 13 TaxID=463040 RepID=UPI0011A138C2|nr:YdcF family protein [Bordetella genomosp. 13]